MKGAMEDLKKSTKALEEDVNINKEDFRRAINQVIKQAKEGPEFLQQKGPGLINKLANDYIDEVRMRTTYCNFSWKEIQNFEKLISEFFVEKVMCDPKYFLKLV